MLQLLKEFIFLYQVDFLVLALSLYAYPVQSFSEEVLHDLHLEHPVLLPSKLAGYSVLYGELLDLFEDVLRQAVQDPDRLHVQLSEVEVFAGWRPLVVLVAAAAVEPLDQLGQLNDPLVDLLNLMHALQRV